jgi:type II secretory pathway pseudopilin PulG
MESTIKHRKYSNKRSVKSSCSTISHKDSFILGLLSSFFLGAIMYSYKRSEKQREFEKQIKLLTEQLDKGFEMDKENIESDWSNIASDLRKSYTKISDEYSQPRESCY